MTKKNKTKSILRCPVLRGVIKVFHQTGRCIDEEEGADPVTDGVRERPETRRWESQEVGSVLIVSLSETPQEHKLPPSVTPVFGTSGCVMTPENTQEKNKFGFSPHKRNISKHLCGNLSAFSFSLRVCINNSTGMRLHLSVCIVKHETFLVLYGSRCFFSLHSLDRKCRSKTKEVGINSAQQRNSYLFNTLNFKSQRFVTNTSHHPENTVTIMAYDGQTFIFFSTDSCGVTFEKLQRFIGRIRRKDNYY